MGSADETPTETGRKRGLGEWLVYLLPVLTAAGAGLWAVITWLYPHPLTEKKASVPAVAATPLPAQAEKAPPATVTASDHSMAFGGPVSGTITNNGAPERAPTKP